MGKQEIMIEQYKLYVGSALKVTEWRQTANNFFLAVNSAVLTLLGYFLTTSTAASYMLMGIIGIGISYLWMKTIESYRQLNSGKFKVIFEMEEKMPVAMFKREWDHLGRGKTKDYVKLTVVERRVTILFMILYIIVIGFALSVHFL